MKTCCRCRRELETDNYSKNKRNKDGFTGYCKECVRQLNSEKRSNMYKTMGIRWNETHPSIQKKHPTILAHMTITQWDNTLAHFNNTCAYCGVGDKTLHQEHFIPMRTGGEFNTQNIVPSCQHCNSSKGNKDFFEWYPQSPCYDKQREKKIMRFLHYVGTHQQLMLCM